MLQGKQISNGFSAEAVNTVVYLKNISPIKKLEFQTPFEFFNGYKPQVKHLRIFGCKAFAHIPKDDRRKLDAKSLECVFVGYCNDHKTYKLFHHKAEWVEAMNEEYNSIMKNQTWELTELPEDKTPISCKWLFKYKLKSDGSIERFKSILVAKGYTQKEGIDFEDTFTLVAKLNTIRILFALATTHKWKIHQLDV